MSDASSSQASRTKAWVLLVIISLLVGYIAGSKTVSPLQPDIQGTSNVVASIRNVGSRPPAGSTADFQEFWNLWTLLKTKYHKQPLDEKKMMYGAMVGLAASTGDPYTTFFEPKVAEEFATSLSGKFSGIGAEIGIKDDQLTVVAPLPDTPADRAGILAGDAILFINGTSTEGMSTERAVSLIRGEKGTVVKLSLGRITVTKDAKGKERKEPHRFEVEITRDTIDVKSVRVKDLRDGVVSIQITGFNEDTATDFSKVVSDVLVKKPKGIIIDLRNDPGGFLDRATAIAGEWTGDDVVVSERRQGKIVEEYHGTGQGRLKGMPTIVLVNGGSASAAEILAGALQDYGYAKLVGTKTFGKGSVQDFTEFPDGSAAKITVAEWLTPKGRFINEVGIQPDVTVERTEKDINEQRDPQLEKALELLTGSTTTSSTAR